MIGGSASGEDESGYAQRRVESEGLFRCVIYGLSQGAEKQRVACWSSADRPLWQRTELPARQDLWARSSRFPLKRECVRVQQ